MYVTHTVSQNSDREPKLIDYMDVDQTTLWCKYQLFPNKKMWAKKTLKGGKRRKQMKHLRIRRYFVFLCFKVYKFLYFPKVNPDALHWEKQHSNLPSAPFLWRWQTHCGKSTVWSCRSGHVTHAGLTGGTPCFTVLTHNCVFHSRGKPPASIKIRTRWRLR